MSVIENEVNWNLPIDDVDKVTIITIGYQGKSEKDYYNDTVSTFYKYAKEKSDIGIYSSPEIFLVQKSGDWFGPIFYIGTLAIENYSTLVTLLDLISEHLKMKYSGEEVTAKFEIVLKDKKKGTHHSVKYDGPSSEVKSVLKSFEKLTKK